MAQEKMKGPQPASQLLAMLRNPQNQVKPAELGAMGTGLEQWLEHKIVQPVTPKQVMEFLKANEVSVQEVLDGAEDELRRKEIADRLSELGQQFAELD